MNNLSPSPWLVFDFCDRQGRPQRLAFTNPSEIITANSLDEVRPALRAVDRAVGARFYAAGYVSYEAAPAFDPALKAHESKMPLLWFGVFREPIQVAPACSEDGFHLSDWQPTIKRHVYDGHIAAVREAIRRGDTYQVNYTMRLRTRFEGDDFAFYDRLRRAQGASYCAYLNLGRYRILSASPELFFRWHSGQIITRPMKGTVRRGRWNEEDRALSAWLAASEKNRAENVMIVDLLRNDLGRIAEIGSVHVPRLFEIERYRTVFQMTSTISAKVSPDVTLEEVFVALFPSGSITGAPKVSTMELIASLEDSPRKVYCGSVGFVAPGEAVFNVAIRTVLLDSQTGVAEYGVGGGITWDSTAEDEYAEALIKAALLTEEWPRFDLLETLRLEDGAYGLLDRHLERLAASADYFDIPVSVQKVRAALEEHARTFSSGVRRARLLVSPEGAVRVESDPLPLPSQASLPVALASESISRANRFLYHKTTNRSFYDAHRAAYPQAFDVLLWNEGGELTEFTIGNLVVEMDGCRWTPPRESGLLAGTFRAHLLHRGELQERVLTRSDLARASRLWLINSVRGWVPVHLVR
jgi:para-aminobenzoate synthetase / 4-amino-4-deoxychorismate lyase